VSKLVLVICALVPIVLVTAFAGIVSNPANARPCLEEFSKGVDGRPTHLILGGDGKLYAAEELEKKILRFDPDTHATREYRAPVTVHDITQGPDGRIWFVSSPANAQVKDTGFAKLGALDPRTGKIQMYSGISRNADPHMLRWDHGRLYITEQAAGELAIFDPRTGKITEGARGLPPGNYIHDIALLPNGDFWAVLQQGNALARFNFRTQRVDKLVRIPIPASGPRDITYVQQRNALYATLFAANKLAEYDLSTGKLTLYDVGIPAIPYRVAISRAPDAKLTFVRPDSSGDFVWVATLAGGELLRFDLRSHHVKAVGCGVHVPAGPLGIATDREGRLWVAITFPAGRIALVKR
jgi:streptogramin lyase